MGQPCCHRIHAEPTWRDALDRQIQSLALGGQAAICSTNLEGGFNGPAFDEWLHEHAWRICGAGRSVGSWINAARAARPHALAHPRPSGCPARHIQHPASAVVPTDSQALPEGLWSLEPLVPRWQVLAFPPRALVGARRMPGRRCIQRRVHPQRGAQTHAPAGTRLAPFMDTIGRVPMRGISTPGNQRRIDP
jgi:hypothetical protein